MRRLWEDPKGNLTTGHQGGEDKRYKMSILCTVQMEEEVRWIKFFMVKVFCWNEKDAGCGGQ